MTNLLGSYCDSWLFMLLVYIYIYIVYICIYICIYIYAHITTVDDNTCNNHTKLSTASTTTTGSQGAPASARAPVTEAE